MKRRGFTFMLSMLMSMMGVEAFAHDIEVANTDGVTIYYTYINNSTELAVSYRGSYFNDYLNEYTGSVVIPETVTYNGTTYSVTSIGSEAFNYCSDLTSVTIPNSVTSIGSEAFNSCSSLTSVTIPNSVASIEVGAFSGCRGLTSIIIPNNVTSIGLQAFEGCTGLTSIDIPNSVTSIGIYAFQGCSGLTSITIPNSVTSIEEGAFADCSGLSSIIVEDGNTIYDSRNGCNAIINTSTNTLITGCKNTRIPNSVTSIGDKAFFGCSDLTSVTIPNSVTRIGEDAFDYTAWYNNQPNGVVYAGKVAYKYKGTMPSNTSIVLEEGTLGIADWAFWDCSGLKSVTIPSSVTNVGDWAFYGCTGLTEVNFNATNCTSMGSDRNSVFLFCNSLTTINIGDNVQNIPSYAFGECGLKSVTIPNSVTSIGENAFYGCFGLTEVNFNATNCTSMGNDNKPVFESCYSLSTINIGDNVQNIPNYAFYGCSELKSVTIGNSVTSIGDDAFFGCNGLTEVNFNATNCTSMGNDNKPVFESCYSLSTINIGDNVQNIPSYAFHSCFELKSVTIPNSVTSIGEHAFGELTSITIPSTLTITNLHDILSNDELEIVKVVVTDYNSILHGVQLANTIIFFSGIVILVDNDGKEIKELVIPEEVTRIEPSAFIKCSGLTSVTIPSSVYSIGSDAFTDCSSLTSITVDKSNTHYDSRDNCNAIIETFTNCLLFGCNNTIIPNSVTSIGNGAFSGSGLTSIDIPNSVTSIGHSAFQDCSGLTNIVIPNSVTSIGVGVFDGCSGLTSVTIGNSVTSIEAAAFRGCNGLKSITIPNSVTSIGDAAICGCSGLTSVTIGNSVTSIGGGAFVGCTGLTSVTIPNSVTNIGEQAFYGCSGLTSVTMESMTPTEIEKNTFSNRANATLYVPYGSKEAYKSAEFWKDFKEIVELEPDYDLSNKLTVSNVSVVQGGTVTLPITMENENEITAFQFELELPNGMTVSEAMLTSRKSNQTLTYNLLDNGRYQFVAFSSNSQAFSGSEGALVNVLLKAGGTMTAGEYTIEVKNIELTTTDEQACVPANCSATLTVSDIKVGDANGDGKVSITDAVAVVNKLLGKPSTNFRADAADVTGDGKITITDAVAIVNIVLGKRPANARMREPQ